MNRITLLLAIVFALFLHSCRTTRPVQPEPTIVPPTGQLQTANEIILQSIQQRSNFDWFSANFSGNVNLGGSRNNFGGQIRIENGQRIWITVTAVGGFFEVARLKITQDSVFLHNRLERTATIRDFSFFREMIGVDFTFDMLQDILVGNYFLPEQIEHTLESYNGNFLFTDERMLGNIAFDFILSSVHHKFLSLTVRDRGNHSVNIRYDNYGVFNSYLFPQNLHIRMTEPMFEAVLHYQRIQLNVPQNMPFSVPASAQRI
ncbi:MAG: DUF4292 domain-containing protein [Bacteroidales bacterium]|nr:DUF4292 domain-containing protein [Bacteroidales bacterium]